MIQQFILFLNKYTNSEKTYSIKIYNELHSNNKKYGLGSSGAVLVSIAKAILTFEKFLSITKLFLNLLHYTI